MNTDDTPTGVSKENKDFAAFLHTHARNAKVPGTCDKAWLADAWMRNRGVFAGLFMLHTEEVFLAPEVDLFYKQAAESYEG